MRAADRLKGHDTFTSQAEETERMGTMIDETSGKALESPFALPMTTSGYPFDERETAAIRRVARQRDDEQVARADRGAPGSEHQPPD